MSTRYTTDAGAINTAGNWDGDTLPVATDVVQIKHAMTVDGAAYARFPESGTFASLDLAATGGASPGLVVTGTVEIAATTVTGIENLADSGASAVLTVTAPGGASSTLNNGYICYEDTTFTGALTVYAPAGASHNILVDVLASLTAVTISGTSQNDFGVDNNGTITGDVIGVCMTARDGVYNNTGSTITGDVKGTSDSDSGVYNDGIITGDVSGVSDSSQSVLNDTNGAITGDVIGVSNTNIGVQNVGTITGDITGTGNRGASALGVYNTGTIVADNITAQGTDAQAFWDIGGTLTEGVGAAGVNLTVRRLDGGQAIELRATTISDELKVTYESNGVTPLVV